MIETRRLGLRLATVDLLRAELEGATALAAALGAGIPATWPPEHHDDEVIQYTLARLAEHGDSPWGYHYVMRRATPEHSAIVVGVAGFKGPPDSNGDVEIGYSIVAEHQRQGYGTEAVEGMLAFAFRDDRVVRVVAQTLSGLEPSIGLLRKTGFRPDGPGRDPEGPAGVAVLRFTHPRPARR